MAYLNTGTTKTTPDLPLSEYHIDTPASAYDLNFCFPVKMLESNAVRLEPFIVCPAPKPQDLIAIHIDRVKVLKESGLITCNQPSIHAKDAWEVFNSQHGLDMYTYIPFNRPKTWQEFLTHQEKQRRNTAWQEFAIIDKTRRSGPKLAGMISMINSSAEHLCSELGAVFVFPEFQRTHVNTHAASLLLQYAFEDLKLRRMQWRANDLNEPSVRAAKRLGFEYEATMLWDRVIPKGKVGRIVETDQGYGSPQAGPGRHSAQLVITWQSWLGGISDHLKNLMARKIIIRD